MNDKGKLLQLIEQQMILVNQLTVQLSNTKVGFSTGRNSVKKALKSAKDTLADLQRQLKQFDTIDMRETGFENGIDTRANQLNSVSDIVENTGKAVVGAMTGQNTFGSVSNILDDTNPNKKQNLLLLGFGALLLLLITKKS